jgi:hypothetical protein
VFLLPKKDYYGLDYIPQVSNASNDIVYYELGRFMELLAVNNPNILELLNTPKEFILYKHPLLELIDPSFILSKLCQNTFGKFALSQIRKAKGLNKKIMNPIAKERKNPLSFCYVNHKQGSLPLLQFLAEKNFKQEDCGLINIAHMNNVFALFHGPDLGYKGLLKDENSNDISLSAIPKGEQQIALLYFNKDAYSSYCKEYKAYWDWVENRNEERFQNTQKHGKSYDAKNMMHTFRLLEMALEIAREKRINVKRPNRDYLLDIKAGKFEYDELVKKAQQLQSEMEEAFIDSELIDAPDQQRINDLCYQLRDKLYLERD